MAVLNTLLTNTIYATILFGVTMLLKRLFQHKLSPLLHYAIWSLFLLRLILPFTLQSPVQLFTLPASSAAVSAPAGLAETERANGEPDAQALGEAPGLQTGAFVPGRQMAPAQAETFANGKHRAFSLPNVLLFVWLTGVATGIGYIAFLYIRLQKRILRNAVKPAKRLCARYLEVQKELGIYKKVPLICQYGLVSPGILFPACVLMPMDTLAAMEDEQVKNTLRHELIHYKRGDHIVSVLLSLLNAIYWFNPIVWIAVRQIRADMETVCDSVVVRNMNAKQKGDYATLILDLFSRSNYRQVVLGMAYGKSESVIEKRIKGVFMNNRSQRSAKIACFALALTMLAACFTTACVPKQATEDAAIIGGADDVTQIVVTNQSASSPEPASTPEPVAVSPLAQKLGVPAHWSYEQRSADQELLVRGNLDIALPYTDAVPVASATCRDVTTADLQNAANAFFQKDVTYTYAAQDTKEYAEQWIEQNQAIYDSVVNGTCENKLPSFEKSVKEQYAAFSNLAKTAPSAAEQRQRPPEFSPLTSETGDVYMGFRGVAERDGTSYLVSASYSDRASAVNIAEVYQDYARHYFGTYRSEPDGLTTTKEQAIALATAMAQSLDGGLALSHVMTVGQSVYGDETTPSENPWAWQCVFQREVNGVGTVYDSRDVGSDIDSNVQGRVNEALEITVDDRGICNVHWINPMTVDSISTPDATLLPFAEIEAKLADLLREKYDYNITRENGDHELYIQRVEFGMMRVGKPDSATYTLEPVWSFFTDFVEHPDYASVPGLLDAACDGDPTSWNSLTLSAIDGRVIDRDRGY